MPDSTPYPTLQKAKSTTFIIRLLIQGHKYSCRRTGEAREFSVRMTQVGGVHRGDCLSLSDAFSLAPADRFCTRSCIIKSHLPKLDQSREFRVSMCCLQIQCQSSLALVLLVGHAETCDMSSNNHSTAIQSRVDCFSVSVVFIPENSPLK